MIARVRFQIHFRIYGLSYNFRDVPQTRFSVTLPVGFFGDVSGYAVFGCDSIDVSRCRFSHTASDTFFKYISHVHFLDAFPRRRLCRCGGDCSTCEIPLLAPAIRMFSRVPSPGRLRSRIMSRARFQILFSEMDSDTTSETSPRHVFP